MTIDDIKNQFIEKCGNATKYIDNIILGGTKK